MQTEQFEDQVQHLPLEDGIWFIDEIPFTEGRLFKTSSCLTGMTLLFDSFCMVVCPFNSGIYFAIYDTSMDFP